MVQRLKKLNNATVKSLGRGKRSDGGGLWLYKTSDGGAKWVLRYSLYGRRHEMGLGGYPAVSLKEARESAEKWNAVVRGGKDAIKERERERREAERNLHVLNEIATDAFETRKAELKGEGKAGSWFTPLKLHVLPKLGSMPIAEIDQRDIRSALAPIWHEKADTARNPRPQGPVLSRLGTARGLQHVSGSDASLSVTSVTSVTPSDKRHKKENMVKYLSGP